MNDPQVNQAIEQTEAELKKRELDLQGKHQEVLSHGKATLELKQDLARQQVKAHLQSADLEEFKQQYEKAKEDATKLLAEKEAEYKQQMEEAQAKIKAAQVKFRQLRNGYYAILQEKVQADIKARQEELLAGIEMMQKKQAEEQQNL